MLLNELPSVKDYLYGYGYQPYTLDWLEVLCKTIEDADFFMKDFSTDNPYLEVFEMFNYRRYVLDMRDYPLDDFLSDFELDCKFGLENLCLCPIKHHELFLFNQKLEAKEFTLEAFYQLQAEYPKLNFYRLLRKMCQW
jgi:hypothetical protein